MTSSVAKFSSSRGTNATAPARSSVRLWTPLSQQYLTHHRVNSRREVQNVDFGLVFPTIKSKITAASLPSPKQLEVSPSLLSSSQRETTTINPTGSDINYSSGSKGEAPVSAHKSDANISKKRKRLVEDQTPSTILHAPRSSQESPSLQKNSLTQDDTIPEAQISDFSNNSIEQATQEKGNFGTEIDSSHSPRSGKTPIRIRKTYEVTESPENAPGSGHRIHGHELVLPPSRSQSLQKTTSLRYSNHTPLSHKNEVKGRNVKKSQSLIASKKYLIQGGNVQVDDDELDELSPERSFILGCKALIDFQGTRKFPANAANMNPTGNTDNELGRLSPEQSSRKIKLSSGRSSVSEPSPDETRGKQSSKTNKLVKMLQISSRSKKTESRRSSPIKSNPVGISIKRAAEATDEELDELSPVHTSQSKKSKTERSMIKNNPVGSVIKQAAEAIVEELDELSPESSSHSKTDKFRKSLIYQDSQVNFSENELPEIVGHEQALNNPNELSSIEINGIRAESPDLDVPVENVTKNVKRQKQNKQGTQSRSRKKDIKLGSKIKKYKKHKVKSYDSSHIPITVHRLSTPVIYEDESADADILNMEIPHSKRQDVNSIDVLSHICQKIIERKLRTLNENFYCCEDTNLRRDYKTELQAIEAFRTELQDRLLEYALCLDNAHSLERRLRDEQRNKLKLRAEILRVRAEREQVAMRIDEIRTEHEKAQDEYMKRNSVNNAIHDLELAIDMGRNATPNVINAAVDVRGTEGLLKKVAQQISSQSSSGGLLRHVKDFNAFLERTAATLEARV